MEYLDGFYNTLNRWFNRQSNLIKRDMLKELEDNFENQKETILKKYNSLLMHSKDDKIRRAYNYYYKTMSYDEFQNFKNQRNLEKFQSYYITHSMGIVDNCNDIDFLKLYHKDFFEIFYRSISDELDYEGDFIFDAEKREIEKQEYSVKAYRQIIDKLSDNEAYEYVLKIWNSQVTYSLSGRNNVDVYEYNILEKFLDKKLSYYERNKISIESPVIDNKNQILKTSKIDNNSLKIKTFKVRNQNVNLAKLEQLYVKIDRLNYFLPGTNFLLAFTSQEIKKPIIKLNCTLTAAVFIFSVLRIKYKIFEDDSNFSWRLSKILTKNGLTLSSNDISPLLSCHSKFLKDDILSKNLPKASDREKILNAVDSIFLQV